MYEIFEKLLTIHGMTIYKFCKETGVSESTIYTWKKKHTQCSAKLQKIVCEYFGVTADYLMTGKEPDKQTVIELTKRDHRDIKKSVDEIMESLDSNNGETLHYDGVEVTLSEENRELIRHALTLAMQAVKLENKEKFNPHKNGK